MPNILELLLIVEFGSSGIIAIILSALYMAGLWRLFEKSGIKGWWAIIPCASEYQLSRCAGREPEGRIYFLSKVAITLSNILSFFLDLQLENDTISSWILILGIFDIIIIIVHFIYHIRIWNGMIEVYGVRKRWIWLCLLSYTEWIPAIVWGFSSKYQPGWKVEDIKAEMARLASSGSATVMDKGLTVNLQDRTVREFFQKKTLLRDIHMAIPQGHMVLLLGGSGAGKTTYLNAINGYEKANAEVMLNGSNMYRQYKRMQYEVGFVPQSEMMRGKDTVLNTLLDAAKLRLPTSVSAKQRRARVNEVMEIFGLIPVQNNLVEKLSGGQKQRTDIARLLMRGCPVMIFDDSLSAVDTETDAKIRAALKQYFAGSTVILISHRITTLSQADEVLVLEKAKKPSIVEAKSVEEPAEAV